MPGPDIARQRSSRGLAGNPSTALRASGSGAIRRIGAVSGPMRISDLAIPGVKLVEPVLHRDERGYFMESFRQSAITEAGGPTAFFQDNHSLSTARFTVRGMHFQIPPHAQAKLVRVVRGAVVDVAVDIRTGSPSFGRSIAIELSAENRRQLLVPAGFAHGYCTLEPDTEVIYKVTAYYDPRAERGLAWDDPEVGIPWPASAEAAILTERDRAWPRLREVADFFPYSDWHD